MANDFGTSLDHEFVRFAEGSNDSTSTFPIYAPQKLCIWIFPVPVRLNSIIHCFGGAFDRLHGRSISCMTNDMNKFDPSVVHHDDRKGLSDRSI